MKKIFKFATGQEIPDGAVYLCSLKNGIMDKDAQTDPRFPVDYKYVWHYFLVEEEEE